MQQGKKPETEGPGTLASALSQAQSIVEAAEARARQLESDAKQSYLDAKETGYREGFEQGKAQALEEAVRLIEETSTLQESLAREAANLALAIAGVVVDGEISTKPERVVKIALRALRESVVGDSVVLICNEADVEQMRSSIVEFRRLAGGAAVNVEADETVARGGCIVRTEFGEVDASIERLLRNIAERLDLTPHEKSK